MENARDLNFKLISKTRYDFLVFYLEFSWIFWGIWQIGNFG